MRPPDTSPPRSRTNGGNRSTGGDRLVPPSRRPSRPWRRRAVAGIALAVAVVALCCLAALTRPTSPTSRSAAESTTLSARNLRGENAHELTAPPTTDPIPTLFPTTPSCVVPTGLSSCPGAPPTLTPSPTAASTCDNEDCIPQPVTTPPGTGQGPGSSDGDSSSCSIWDPSTWLSCLFQPIVTDAINPLLSMLANTLLTTPAPNSLPIIGWLWTNSWEIMVASYGVLVLIAGIVVMAYGTIQQRHTIRDVLPRVAGGFFAGTLSLFAATKMIELANALAFGLLGSGVDASQAGKSFGNIALDAISGSVWLLLVALVLVVMIIVLLITWIVRVAVTVLLIAAAPLLLMLHALPQTDGIARWWWKAFASVLAIQIAQSLVLTIGMTALLSHGAASLFGS